MGCCLRTYDGAPIDRVYLFSRGALAQGRCKSSRLSDTSAIAQRCTATLSRSLVAPRAATFSDVGVSARQGWPRPGLGLFDLLEPFLLWRLGGCTPLVIPPFDSRGMGALIIPARCNRGHVTTPSSFLCLCKKRAIFALSSAVSKSSPMAPALSKSSRRSFCGKVFHCRISAAPRCRSICSSSVQEPRRPFVRILCSELSCRGCQRAIARYLQAP